MNRCQPKLEPKLTIPELAKAEIVAINHNNWCGEKCIPLDPNQLNSVSQFLPQNKEKIFFRIYAHYRKRDPIFWEENSTNQGFGNPDLKPNADCIQDPSTKTDGDLTILFSMLGDFFSVGKDKNKVTYEGVYDSSGKLIVDKNGNPICPYTHEDIKNHANPPSPIQVANDLDEFIIIEPFSLLLTIIKNTSPNVIYTSASFEVTGESNLEIDVTNNLVTIAIPPSLSFGINFTVPKLIVNPVSVSFSGDNLLFEITGSDLAIGTKPSEITIAFYTYGGLNVSNAYEFQTYYSSNRTSMAFLPIMEKLLCLANRDLDFDEQIGNFEFVNIFLTRSDQQFYSEIIDLRDYY